MRLQGWVNIKGVLIREILRTPPTSILLSRLYLVGWTSSDLFNETLIKQ